MIIRIDIYVGIYVYICVRHSNYANHVDTEYIINKYIDIMFN